MIKDIKEIGLFVGIPMLVLLVVAEVLNII